MNKNVMYGILLIGGIIYYGYTTYWPEYEGWETTIKETQENLEKARRTAPQLVDVQRQQEELQKKLNASLSRLPAGDELDNLLGLVIPTMEEAGIQSSQIGGKSVDAATEEDVYRVHPIRITRVKNVTLPQVLSLLDKLMNSDRIMSVTSFNINKAPDKKSGTFYELDLNIVTYSYKDEGASK